MHEWEAPADRLSPIVCGWRPLVPLHPRHYRVSTIRGVFFLLPNPPPVTNSDVDSDFDDMMPPPLEGPGTDSDSEEHFPPAISQHPFHHNIRPAGSVAGG